MKKQSQLIRDYDWDTLIILDACRWDMFEKVNNIPGESQEVNSGAFNTSSWYKTHWNPENAKNTILISAQPMAWWIKINENFHSSFLVKGKDDWMNPKPTIDKALSLDKLDQRLLIHLIPPHLPYQGLKGKEFINRIGKKEGDGLWDVKFGKNSIQDIIENYGRDGNWDELRTYYIENIEFVLPEIKRYIENTVRKVVVTSDHGELLGEKDFYGHSHEHHILMEVPWLEVK